MSFPRIEEEEILLNSFCHVHITLITKPERYLRRKKTNRQHLLWTLMQNFNILNPMIFMKDSSNIS